MPVPAHTGAFPEFTPDLALGIAFLLRLPHGLPKVRLRVTRPGGPLWHGVGAGFSRDFSQRGGRDRDSLLPGVEVPGLGGDDRPSCCPQDRRPCGIGPGGGEAATNLAVDGLADVEPDDVCSSVCSLPRTYRFLRGESPGRGVWDDTDELVRTRCRHLLSGGSQVRTLPGAPLSRAFAVEDGRAGRKCVQFCAQL